MSILRTAAVFLASTVKNCLLLLSSLSLVITLLLSGNAAQAAVLIYQGNSVIAIRNLEVYGSEGGPELYDIDFLYDSGRAVYGPEGDTDFPEEADARLALESVLVALNLVLPSPVAAGPEHQDRFYMGAFLSNGVMTSIGGENFAGLWDNCESDCIAGAALIANTAPVTWAKFKPSDESPIDSPSGSVDLSGTVQSTEGDPLCAMVLASGQYTFSCNPNGPYSLSDLPRENNGTRVEAGPLPARLRLLTALRSGLKPFLIRDGSSMTGTDAMLKPRKMAFPSVSQLSQYKHRP
jgi:hypothetical protein